MLESNKLKIYYAEIQAIVDSLPDTYSGPYCVNTKTVENYNRALHNIVILTGDIDYERFEVQHVDGDNHENIRELEPLAKSLLAVLKVTLDFESRNHDSADSIPYDFTCIHPSIRTKCEKLFLSENYAEAAEKSFKAIKDKLRELTGFEKGSEAFGKGKLHIKGSAATNVDSDFNEAVKFLTMAIDMFRNEKSHTSEGNIDKARAFQYLMMSSLAMDFLDNAEIL